MTDVPTIPPRRWAFAVSLVFVVVAPIASMAYAQSRPAPKSRHIYALTTQGKVLPPGAHLSPGQRVTIIADGFERNSSVEVVDASRKKISYTRADRNGVARTRFVAPKSRSAPRPLVVMAAPKQTQRRRAINGNLVTDATATSGRARRGRDPQTLTVRAPLVRQFPYAPGRGHQVDVGSTNSQHPGSDSGGLASTGFDVIALIIAGITAILLGLLSIVASRRRKNMLYQA